METREDMVIKIKKLDRKESQLYREDMWYAKNEPDEVGKYHNYSLPINYTLRELQLSEPEAYHLSTPFHVQNLRAYGEGFTVYFRREELGLKKWIKIKAKTLEEINANKRNR